MFDEPKYRLSDFVKGYTFKTDKLFWTNIPKIFPNTYASKYVSRVFDELKKDYRIDILDEIVEKNPQNCISIHLRSNDVLMDYKNGKYIWDDSRGDANYEFQPEYLNGFFSFLLKKTPNIFDSNIDVKLYCSSHYEIKGRQAEINYSLISECDAIVKSYGMNLITPKNNHPDIDFQELCNSKILCITSGGFGKLASLVAERRKSLVYSCRKWSNNER